MEQLRRDAEAGAEVVLQQRAAPSATSAALERQDELEALVTQLQSKLDAATTDKQQAIARAQQQRDELRAKLPTLEERARAQGAAS